MYFRELLRELSPLAAGGDPDRPVTGIAYDSRRVRPGYLFVAVKGLVTDGHRYIDDALQRGASCLLIQDASAEPGPGEGPAWARVENTRRDLGRAAAAFYGFPAWRLHLTGVTGTNGKTTTTHLVAAMYEQRGPVGLVGTIHNRIGAEVLPVERTTPESADLQELLSRMAERGVDRAAMEVSSHALSLHRVEGCRFRAAVFTNLTREHLDFHGTMEAYFGAKASLFTGLPAGAVPVINIDDPYGMRLAEMLGRHTVTYGLERPALVRAVDPGTGPRGTKFTVESAWGRFPVEMRLVGRFNIYNALAAAALGLAEGFSPEEITAALSGVPGVPGRFEPVFRGQDFGVIVDYAHTPDGLENVLTAARRITSGRLIVVFGCGGDRDRTKRPLMGRIGVQKADLAVITSDNPRTEDPVRIIAEVEQGARLAPDAAYHVVPDRREAIGRALEEAETGDLVIIAGKGHEDYQIIGHTRQAFDDRRVAAEKLAAMGYTVHD